MWSAGVSAVPTPGVVVLSNSKSELDELIAGAAAGDRRSSRQVVSLLMAGRENRQRTEALLVGLSAAAPTSPHATATLAEALPRLSFLNVEIRKFLFAAEDVEDALQETVMAVIKGLPGFRHDASFVTWSTAIARNTAINQVRRSVRELPPLRPEPQRFSSVASNRLDVRQALELCPEPYREIVRMRDIEDLTYVEISERLSIKLNTVRSRLSRGRAHIVDTLDGR